MYHLVEILVYRSVLKKIKSLRLDHRLDPLLGYHNQDYETDDRSDDQIGVYNGCRYDDGHRSQNALRRQHQDKWEVVVEHADVLGET